MINSIISQKSSSLPALMLPVLSRVLRDQEKRALENRLPSYSASVWIKAEKLIYLPETLITPDAFNVDPFQY